MLDTVLWLELESLTRLTSAAKSSHWEVIIVAKKLKIFTHTPIHTKGHTHAHTHGEVREAEITGCKGSHLCSMLVPGKLWLERLKVPLCQRNELKPNGVAPTHAGGQPSARCRSTGLGRRRRRRSLVRKAFPPVTNTQIRRGIAGSCEKEKAAWSEWEGDVDNWCRLAANGILPLSPSL